MIPGMGAVATTLIAGVEAVRRGFAKPIGSMTQMGTIRLGKRTDDRTPLIKDFVPIARSNDLVFTGWDIFGGNLYDAAKTAGVLDRDQLESMGPFLESIEPMPAAFDQHYVKRLTAQEQEDRQEQVRPRQPDPQRHRGVQVEDRPPGDDLVRLDRDLPRAQAPCTRRSRPSRRASSTTTPTSRRRMLYAYAALKEGIPFANGAPNLTVDIPALQRALQAR